MTLASISLIVVSAIIHVGWNALGRHERASASLLLVANTMGGICLLIGVLAVGGPLPPIPGPVVFALALTGLFQAGYYAALAGAYRRGDLSLVYPIARSLPPVLVLGVSFLLGRGEQIGAGCVLGIGAIVIGSLILPLRSFSELRIGSYLTACSALAALAAVGTAGYSLLDDHGLRLLRELPESSLGGVRAALVYAPLEALSASLWLSLWVLADPRERRALGDVMRTRKARALLTGLGIYASYTLVLAAMGFADDVTYVVGFRQLGVPLGALVGIRLLGETPHAPRLWGVALASLGLVLIAFD